MPAMPKTDDPKDIVQRAKVDFLLYIDQSCNNEIPLQKTQASTQVGLAKDAILQNNVTLVNAGCWMVKGTDGQTPYAVTLFPKETCSCPAKKHNGMQDNDWFIC
jgi:hypothetical protein